MILFQKKNFGFIQRYPIVGGRRLSNYWWSVVLFLGGCGFLLTGISSYFNRNLLLVTPKSENAMQTRSYQYPLRIRYAWVNTPKVVFQTLLDPSINILYNSDRYTNHTCGYPLGFSYGRSRYENQKEQVLFPTEAVLPADPVRSTGLAVLLPRRGQQEVQLPPDAQRGIDSKPSVSIPFAVQSKARPQTIFSTLAQYPNENKDELEIINGVPSLLFFPQGLVLSFYGFLSLCLSFHLWLTLIWKIGVGFNEFNGNEKYVRIFRWGRPGKNRRIDIKYTKEVIETIKIELVPKPALVLHVKGEKDIPLANAALIGDFIPLEDLETQATELTTLLKIPLEIVD